MTNRESPKRSKDTKAKTNTCTGCRKPTANKKYCSYACYYASDSMKLPRAPRKQKTPQLTKCKHCGTGTTNKVYCSRTCMTTKKPDAVSTTLNSRTMSKTEFARYQRARRYGLSFAELDKLVAHNNGMCNICNVNPGVAVDHCHATGVVRGYLCMRCNTGLGFFNDNVALMQTAIAYLKATPK